MRTKGRLPSQQQVASHKIAERRIADQWARAHSRLDAVRAQRSDEDILQANAIIRGLIPRIQGSVDAWCGRRVPMKVELHSLEFAAYTDFKRITIQLPEGDVSMDFVADMRGLAYHEAGHLIRTIPLSDLLPAVGGPQTTSIHRINEWLVDKNKVTIDHFQRAWNVLEDQRMETGMVRVSKNLANYYNVIVLTHVLRTGITDGSHLLLYGRRHVDADVRAVARQTMVTAHDEAFVQGAEAVIRSYMGATEPAVMFQAVIDFIPFIQAMQTPPMPVDGHNSIEGAPGTPEQTEKRAGDTAAPITDEPSEAGDESGAGDEGEDDDDDSGSKSVQEALDKARDARNDDRNLAGDLRAFNEAKAAGMAGTPLERLTPVVNTDPAAIAQGTRINQRIRTIMEQARAEAAPSWQRGQRFGVLDVVRHKVRQPTDMEFFKNYADGGDLRYPNLAVSVLLDGSGSMNKHQEALGIAAYAMKSACDASNVPCTVSVYDVNAYLLYEGDDRPLEVSKQFTPGGGTNPYEAMQLLDGQVYDKRRHLVMILTDGQWGGWGAGGHSLADYDLPNRDFVLFYFQTGVTRINGQEIATNVKIDSLDDMPLHLQRYILRSL